MFNKWEYTFINSTVTRSTTNSYYNCKRISTFEEDGLWIRAQSRSQNFSYRGAIHFWPPPHFFPLFRRFYFFFFCPHQFPVKERIEQYVKIKQIFIQSNTVHTTYITAHAITVHWNIPRSEGASVVYYYFSSRARDRLISNRAFTIERAYKI